MFSRSSWSQKADNINTEISGLEQRRNQTGTSESEKTAIDRRIEELKRKKEEILREMSSHACDVMERRYGKRRSNH